MSFCAIPSAYCLQAKADPQKPFIVKGAYPPSSPIIIIIVVVSFISKYRNENYFIMFLLEQNKGFGGFVALGKGALAVIEFIGNIAMGNVATTLSTSSQLFLTGHN